MTTRDSEDDDPTDQRDSQTLQIKINASFLAKFNIWLRDLTESLGGLRNFLLALLGVLGVLSLIVWRVRNLGKKPQPGDQEMPDEV